VPLLVAAYFFVLQRKKTVVVKFPSLDLVRAARGREWRRHVPPALLLAALVAGLLAAARPSAVVTLPMQQRTIILAIDVSLSMRATDVQPSRIEAAKEAAKAFVQKLPGDVRIGIVSFAGSALVAQRPTNNVEDLVAAIDRLQLDRHTAIGSGIIVSLATLLPEHGIDIEQYVLGRVSHGMRAPATGKAEKKPPADWKPVEPGSNPSKAVILLTDGRRTIGPHPAEAARMAADRGVKVFTVGFGTPGGGMVGIEGYSFFMAFDEETLKQVAGITHGEYFQAATAGELAKVYETLNSRLVIQREETEIGFLFAAAAALLLLAASGLSLAWFGRSA
jgi:Ca-activated chloride channel family protein